MSQLFWSLQMKCRKYSVSTACDLSMLVLLWGLNGVVVIFEIFRSLHNCRMTTCKVRSAICGNQTRWPKQWSLSTNALSIVSASWFGIGTAVRYLDSWSWHERIYLFPFSVDGSGPMQSILGLKCRWRKRLNAAFNVAIIYSLLLTTGNFVNVP